MSAFAAMLANTPSTPSEFFPHEAVTESAPVPAVNTPEARAVRHINLGALTAFLEHVRSAHPDLPELTELLSEKVLEEEIKYLFGKPTGKIGYKPTIRPHSLQVLVRRET